VPGATVLTYYTALGDAPDARRQLLERPGHWRDAIVAELSCHGTRRWTSPATATP
jgi:hypothetical protein